MEIMTDERKKNIIENYVLAYNGFDIEKMLTDLHDEIIFKNISNGEITLEIEGLEAFRAQAAQVVNIFAEREQKIKNMVFSADDCEIDIDYQATLAADLPNGLKTGDKIELKGKSIFRFAGGKITEIQDIS
jgi:predicted ester cyclase